ncbi:fructose-1,6-bisphosphate aldolase/phosphatase [Limnochorda pilosa]|uniref:Fructose-1,6-bisphosphate aldolase/phosphatase n=1 Tax=Limnochorda pilosa TaxID=1555112 RepID=A0A0K2SMK3_LIMPI|nr:fructose-1,6-bisphosphate aldolase/phosphatase [Limnochorda pilosa]BAS28358.1 fructose-1 6-bisphosphatase [Limnochorda pilosa]
MATLSVLKADTGGYVGHSATHPDLVEAAETLLKGKKEDGTLLDFCVGQVGDDVALILSHTRGAESEAIHRVAWEVFQQTTDVAKRLKLYGAGQDLLSDAFSGNLKGLGPGIAEMEIDERPSEPVLVFLADKTEPGAWNLPLYRIFADPFNTPGLVIDPKMHDGFVFEILDLKADQAARFKTPEESYDLLMFIGAPSHYVVRRVLRAQDEEVVAATSTQKLSLMAGRYVGKDDPVMIVRAQSGFPAVGEILEAFARPHLVGGWMRGSHVGPIMPVGFRDAVASRFDGPPRVACYGFQLNRGRLVGPRDLFADVAFDPARRQAGEMAEMMRSMGPFEPHRLPLDEMEYTTMPEIMARVRDRFVPVEEAPLEERQEGTAATGR